MMIQFTTDGDTSSEGFRAYFEAGGDGTHCELVQPFVRDVTLAEVGLGSCQQGFTGPLDGECWPSAVGCGCMDRPGESSSSTWFDGTNNCSDYAINLDWCGLYGDTDFNGQGSASTKCCACGGGFYPSDSLSTNQELVSNGANLLVSQDCAYMLTIQV